MELSTPDGVSMMRLPAVSRPGLQREPLGEDGPELRYVDEVRQLLAVPRRAGGHGDRVFQRQILDLIEMFTCVSVAYAYTR